MISLKQVLDKNIQNIGGPLFSYNHHKFCILCLDRSQNSAFSSMSAVSWATIQHMWLCLGMLHEFYTHLLSCDKSNLPFSICIRLLLYICVPHPLILFVIFSTNSLQSTIDSFLGELGTPRYLKGNFSCMYLVSYIGFPCLPFHVNTEHIRFWTMCS